MAMISDIRKEHFASRVTDGTVPEAKSRTGIWELPDNLIDEVGGANDFTQSTPGGGINFAQNFSCFAQNIGPYGGPQFSQGTPPRIIRQIEE